jgi:DNA-binding MarR family transcriptional regulator
MNIASAVAAVQGDLFEVLASSNLSTAAVPVLEYLFTSPDHCATMSELGRALSLTPFEMVKLADRLARRGMIGCRSHRTGPGEVVVDLTPQGRRDAEWSGQLLRVALNHLMQQQPVTRRELQTTAGFLSRFVAAASP